jgi:glutaredoxin-like protein
MLAGYVIIYLLHNLEDSMDQNKIIMYGADWCRDCRRAKQFFYDYGIDFEWIDTSVDKEAEELVRQMNQGKRIIPTIIFQDGSMLVEPSNAQLAEKLKIEL